MEARGKEKLMRALALLYHDIVPAGRFDASGFNTPGAHRYKLTAEAFEQHLAAIASAVRNAPVRVLDSGWQDSFLLTIDDGGSSAMHVAERLEKRGWRAHFFITTDYIGTSGFLTSGEIRELSARGHVIGSHSCSHPMPMWSCTAEQLLREWKLSREKLEQIIGDRVTIGSVPGGFYGHKIGQAAADAGYEVLFNSEPTRAVSAVDGCRILGRYGILRDTPAAVASKLASGDVFACARQQTLWNFKKLLKKIIPRQYAAARTYMLESNKRPADSNASQERKQAAK